MMEKQKWRSVNTVNNGSSKPSPRWGHSNCVIGEEVVLFGGYADSIYMNDLWAFNTRSMEWTEIKTTGNIPSHRSNCSLTYDQKNNRIIMFGGGGSNKTRYNTINILDWNTKVWTEITPAENESAPWQRTYHSAQLIYPYLIVFGGEGIADLDDLWVYNFETSAWSQIPIEKGALKPCARRFHSSCLVGNEFFVIAGCHTKYRCLSDIYSINLTSLIETGSLEGMQWKERNIKGYAFLTRWGHTSSSYDGKIYIFGGRFSNDLNDLLVFDPTKDELKSLKVAPETIPKPRRRPSTCFIGSCLLMFGGFNQDYYNDLHFINVGISTSKPKKKSQKTYNVWEFVNKQQVSDTKLSTINNEQFFCHKGFIRKNFQNEQDLDSYIESINGNKTKAELTKIMEALYQGHGSIPQFYKHGGYLACNEQEKEQNFLRNLDELKQNNELSNNIFSRPKKIKVFNNCIACISDDHYSEFLQKNRQNIYKDTTIIVNNFYKLDVCSPILRAKSKFFNHILSKKFKRNQQSVLDLSIPSNIVLFEILVNFMMYNYLIVPDSMTSKSWIQLYDLADYLSLKNIKEIIVFYLQSLITEATVSEIFVFSQKQKIEYLALICAQFKIKCADNFEKLLGNKYISRAFQMNKFELNQKMLVQADTMMFKKKKSSDSVQTEGEKENYEVANS